MNRPRWSAARSGVVFAGGWVVVVYEARYATVQSPAIIAGGFGLILAPVPAALEGRSGRHRHHAKDGDD